MRCTPLTTRQSRGAVDEPARDGARFVGLRWRGNASSNRERCRARCVAVLFLLQLQGMCGVVVLKNALLEFVQVVEANEQTVAGTLHHLMLEAKELYFACIG
ncbi:hypothetical protein ZWY2020_017916 [Hordeum vulgare]|nr:hypothetical protein ZWY2020_017916 [Hordeum vulgare]